MMILKIGKSISLRIFLICNCQGKIEVQMFINLQLKNLIKLCLLPLNNQHKASQEKENNYNRITQILLNNNLSRCYVSQKKRKKLKLEIILYMLKNSLSQHHKETSHPLQFYRALMRK
jgi:hypothetical protein